MKGKFDLQNALFSSDTEDDDFKMPGSQLINLYNAEYSFVLNEAKQFFTQCKELINRFVSLNQYGLGFNLPMIWTSFIKMEHNVCSIPFNKQSRKQKQWDEKKPKYEGMFHRILEKMHQVVGDLVEIQMEIKEAYLNQNVESPKKNLKTDRTMKKQGSRNSGRSSQNSRNLRKVLRREEMQDIIEDDDDDMRQIISTHLFKENSDLFSEDSQIVCHQGKNIEKNLDSLDKKMQTMIEAALECKKREQESFQQYQNKKDICLLEGEQNLNKGFETKKQIDAATIRNLSTKLAHKRMHSKQFTGRQGF